MMRFHSVNTFPQLLMIWNLEFSRNNIKSGKFDYRIWIKGKKLNQKFQIKTIKFALQISKLEFTANTYLMFINFYTCGYGLSAFYSSYVSRVTNI